MGRVSFALADAAAEAGAVLAGGLPVAAIEPSVGVRLEGGDLIEAAAIVSNADPVRTLGLLTEAPSQWKARIDGWDTRSPVLKLNCALSRLPPFSAAGSDERWIYRAMVVLSTGIDDTQAAFAAAERGDPAPDWCELYFQTAYDPTVAPPGRHTLSVFAQYAPYTLAEGDWDSRRDEIADRLLNRIALWAPDIGECIEYRELLGPPDIERRVGLTGGHIFQGSCLPDQMWDRRLPARTPVAGLYLCGAATHPGGSVIGINGRNAAMAVLADTDDIASPS
jgi:phytoene dehydrogenase-like protein